MTILELVDPASPSASPIARIELRAPEPRLLVKAPRRVELGMRSGDTFTRLSAQARPLKPEGT